MAKIAPININGKIMLFLSWGRLLAGWKNKTIKVVAMISLNKPMVSGVAEVNLIKTGIPAIKINVVAASTPIGILSGFCFN